MSTRKPMETVIFHCDKFIHFGITRVYVAVDFGVYFFSFRSATYTRVYEFLFISFLLQFVLVQMSSLSKSNSAIYSSTLSNHVYLSLDIILVYLKVAMHQGSVLSLLLFGVVMDVFPIKAKNVIVSELLYADEIVLTVPIMEQLGRRLAELKVSLLEK